MGRLRTAHEGDSRSRCTLSVSRRRTQSRSRSRSAAGCDLMHTPRLNRRTVLGLLGSAAFEMFSHAKAQTPAAAKVTLLGTAGGPPPHLQRSQPASLLEVGGRTYLIDAGENVAQQLLRAGSAPQKVNALFL